MARIRAKRVEASVLAIDVTPTPETLAHGDHHRETITGTFGADGEPQGAQSVTRNWAVDTVERWRRRGVLDERQLAAIAIYRRAWSIAFGRERIASMKWGCDSSVLIHGHLSVEQFVQTGIDAKGDIGRFDTVIFAGLPRHYFDLWQNVVLYDEPLGIVGSRLGYAGRGKSEMAAQIMVKFFCDAIVHEWRL